MSKAKARARFPDFPYSPHSAQSLSGLPIPKTERIGFHKNLPTAFHFPPHACGIGYDNFNEIISQQQKNKGIFRFISVQ